jgi:glutathione S-transferase
MERITTIWGECSGGGPFLFGEFGIVDAMYAPIVNRIEVYKIPQSVAVQRYCDAIRALPAWQEWQEAGRAEPWICDNVEV